MLEVEQASMNSEAQARLAQIRSQLGLGTGSEAAAERPTDTPAGTPAEGTPAPPGGGSTAG